MYERDFTKWAKWINREALPSLEYPGVYVIARSHVSLERKRFTWLEDIIYIGMTNAESGLRGRLRQFDRTIQGHTISHGGADRVRHQHKGYRPLVRGLYVATAHFVCNPKSVHPLDLKRKGRVASFEYACLAEYAKRYKRLPRFNDKSAPKWSRSSQ